MWIIPAKVTGAWKTSRGTLNLKQEFQMLSGSLNNGNASAIVSDAKMLGDQITFTAGGAQYTGRVSGNSIDGTYKSGADNGKWSATKQ